MMPNNPWKFCLEVQKYLQAKYNIDFVTSRTKIFSLAKKLKIPTKKARKILEKNNFNYRKVIDEEYY